MNKSDVTKLFKGAKNFVAKKSPDILIGAGVVGMCTTVVLAVKATPKALDLLEEKRKEKLRAATVEEAKAWSEDTGIPLTPVEYVTTCWRPYVPAAISGAISIACVIGSRSVSARRNAALYSAYKLSETAFSEYKEKVTEMIGEKKEKVIKDQIAKDKVEKNPASKTEIFVTGKGDTLFLDPISNRYFTSDIEKVRKSINDLNWNMNFHNEMYVSLSELYDELGLSHTKISDDIGWRIDDGLIEPVFSAQVSDDGRPCLVLDFTKAPTYGFDNYY